MRSVLLTTPLFLCVLACQPDPTGPDGPASLSLGRSGSTVTAPMQVRADLAWLVDQSAPALALCSPRPGLAVGSGQGEATHLGRFEVVHMDHCSVDLAVVPPLIDGTGTFEWRAADGSSIEGTYVFLFLPPVAGGFFTLLVEGGTGRFAGATGQLDFDPRSALVTCVDVLCLNGATWSPVFTGQLSVPHP